MYFAITDVSFIWFLKRLRTDNTFWIDFLVFFIHLLLRTGIRLKWALLTFLNHFILIFCLNSILDLIEPPYLTIIELFFIWFYLMMRLMFDDHFFHNFLHTRNLLFNKIISWTRPSRWFYDIIVLVALINIKIH